MKIIKLKNDYGTYPIWIYDENHNLIDNDLPEEISNDKQAIELRDYIMEAYMKLFINNDYEFSYIGFKTADNKIEFIKKSNDFENLLREKVGNNYIIINELYKND